MMGYFSARLRFDRRRLAGLLLFCAIIVMAHEKPALGGVNAREKPALDGVHRIAPDAAPHAVQLAQFDIERRMRRLLRRGKPNRAMRREMRRLRRMPQVFEGLVAPQARSRADCVAPDQIQKRLRAQGWWDFDALGKQDNDFRIAARRPNGVGYELRIDSCSGRIIAAKRLADRRGSQRLWPR
jgi:hypothetical protein